MITVVGTKIIAMGKQLMVGVGSKLSFNVKTSDVSYWGDSAMIVVLINI